MSASGSLSSGGSGACAPGPAGYVISSDCMDCGVCEYMCPESAIYEAKHQFIIDKKLCNGCAVCVPYCPARAIVPRAEFKSRQERTVHKVLGGALADQ